MAQPLPPTPPPDEEAIIEERRRHQTQETWPYRRRQGAQKRPRRRPKIVWFVLACWYCGLVWPSQPGFIALASGSTQLPNRYSWTLMMMFIGVVLGCINAWYWVSRERSKMER